MRHTPRRGVRRAGHAVGWWFFRPRGVSAIAGWWGGAIREVVVRLLRRRWGQAAAARIAAAAPGERDAVAPGGQSAHVCERPRQKMAPAAQKPPPLPLMQNTLGNPLGLSGQGPEEALARVHRRRAAVGVVTDAAVTDLVAGAGRPGAAPTDAPRTNVGRRRITRFAAPPAVAKIAVEVDAGPAARRRPVVRTAAAELRVAALAARTAGVVCGVGAGFGLRIARVVGAGDAVVAVHLARGRAVAVPVTRGGQVQCQSIAGGRAAERPRAVLLADPPTHSPLSPQLAGSSSWHA